MSTTARRRRSGVRGAFNPLTATSWYATGLADDPLWTPPANGAAVDSWRNAGSLGTALTESGTNRPTYASSVAVLGGKPAIQFTGLNSHRLSVLTGVTLAQPFTFAAVVAFSAFASAPSFLGINSVSTGRRAGLTTGALPTMSGGTVLSDDVALSINTPYLISYYFNGNSSEINVNGTSVVSGIAGTLALDQIVLGMSRTGPSTYGGALTGHIAWYGIVSGNLPTLAAWAGLKRWVGRYGITAA